MADLKEAAKQISEARRVRLFGERFRMVQRDQVNCDIINDIDLWASCYGRALTQGWDCQPMRGLLIMGDIGVGKTSILSILYRAIMEAEIEWRVECESIYKRIEDLWFEILAEMVVTAATSGIRYYTHDSLITTLRECKSESRISELAHKSRLVIVDDFGRGHSDASGWNESLQDEFIDELWKNEIPVLITTNMNGAALRGWSGMERVVDRIGDPSWITALTIAGRSRRKEKV